MKEYLVYTLAGDDNTATQQLNSFSQDGWILVCYIGNNRIVMERYYENYKLE